MAYACPVCDALVPDGEHLAHHLAIVAITRGGDHEAWLEDRIEDWQERDPDSLAADAVEHAEEVEHDLVDDPRASGADHAHGAHSQEPHGGASPGGERPSGVTGDARSHSPLGSSASDPGTVDAETAEILQEARELTEAMQGDDDSVGDGRNGEATDDATDETDTDE